MIGIVMRQEAQVEFGGAAVRHQVDGGAARDAADVGGDAAEKRVAVMRQGGGHALQEAEHGEDGGFPAAVRAITRQMPCNAMRRDAQPEGGLFGGGDAQSGGFADENGPGAFQGLGFNETVRAEAGGTFAAREGEDQIALQGGGAQGDSGGDHGDKP